MARNNLGKFRERLALVSYFRKAFGIENPEDPEQVSTYYDSLENTNEGYNAEGRSYVYQFISYQANNEFLTEDQLLRYDSNIKSHLEDINERRSEPIRLKPFQLLAAFMTEAYLDKLAKGREEFLQELNSFVERQNEDYKGRIKFPKFEKEDLNKLAFWMATGSGKTIMMHLNYYQYLNYAEEIKEMPDNVILVTPNEGLSKQHLEGLKKSSIPAHHFNSETIDLWNVGENLVKVIEIHKLVDEKTGDGLSIEVDSFEGQNLVLVDEGHKGAGSTAQTWRNRRESISKEGFTFEYSATFGQAIAGAGTGVEEEYGKSILFDYSYPRFYEDGYGKDYNILNLKNELDEEIREKYLLANLLTYYEQVHIFDKDPETFYKEYNVKHPLLVFIGHSVNAGKTSAQLGKNDERSVSDVEEVLLFLKKVMRNKNDWVPKAINEILSGDSELAEGDKELFEEEFRALGAEDLSSEEIYDRLLEDIFHLQKPSKLEIVDIKNAKGEIGLRGFSSDEYFGVINIGNDQVFRDRLRQYEDISVDDDEFEESLFHSINKKGSNINVLLGSRKFIEGWDSWRVSTMGLMNFGRGEGPQVIQLFGRGVRLLGKDRSLKRSSELEGKHPKNISILETLNIFGVRADYMSQFNEYLAEEGIETETRETFEIETKTNGDFEGNDLVTVRKDESAQFSQEEFIQLEVEESINPQIQLSPQLDIISSKNSVPEENQDDEQEVVIPREYLGLLDWDDIYEQIWQFRVTRGYSNLALSKEQLREVIEKEYYTLQCPENFLELQSFDELERIHRIVVMILSKYIEQYYKDRRSNWEKKQLSYKAIGEEVNKEEGNFITSYQASVKLSSEDVVEKLKQKMDSESMYEGEEGIPNRVYFDRHLYLPLITESENEDVEYSPPPLNDGEEELVREIKSFFNTGQGATILEKWEVYLLRNQSRGRGVGFLTGEKHDQQFFPDFIMWLKGEDRQHVIFLEPHGLALEGDPLANHRVKFHEGIKDYEESITEHSSRKDVSLHLYLISQTSFEGKPSLKNRTRLDKREEFHQKGIYFEEDGVNPILEDVLSGD